MSTSEPMHVSQQITDNSIHKSRAIAIPRKGQHGPSRKRTSDERDEQ